MRKVRFVGSVEFRISKQKRALGLEEVNRGRRTLRTNCRPAHDDPR